MATTANAANITNRAITRTIFRWVHIVFAIPILGYIYIRLTNSRAMPSRPGLSSFPSWSFQDCGCGKAMWCDD